MAVPRVGLSVAEKRTQAEAEGTGSRAGTAAGIANRAVELAEFERLLRLDSAPPNGVPNYLISHKWLTEWRHWASHAVVSAAEGDEVEQGTSSPQRAGSDDSLQQASRSAGNGIRRGACAGPPRPGPIDNQPLLEASSGTLRSDAIDHFDYEVLPAGAWEMLQAAYGGGPAIPRDAICQEQDGTSQCSVTFSEAVSTVASTAASTAASSSRDTGRGKDDACGTKKRLRTAPLAARTAGINNLGNTCFMSSSLQCLANVPTFRDFFLSGEYRESLCIQGQHTDKTAGKLAEGFAQFLRRLWNADVRGAVSPYAFKDVIDNYDDRFSDSRQHDSMEFIETLIDGLKEDCNRVKGKKPYVERKDADGRPDEQVALEAANDFLLRNDSRVDDMFVGMVKSTTVCSQCQHESVVFEPFLSVKVPLTNPREAVEASYPVTAVPRASSGKPIQSHVCTVDKTGTMGQLCEAVAEKAGLEVQSCLAAEIYRGRLSRYLDDAFLLEDLSSMDALVVYELDDAAGFKLAADLNWGSAELLEEGDIVTAASTFKSNNSNKVQLRQGLCGKVLQVDNDGDAQVKFDGIDRKQWVFKKNFTNLRREQDMTSNEKRFCPKDEKAYTLRELMGTFDDDVTKGDCTIAELRSLWREELKPIASEAEASRNSALVVHLRSSQQVSQAMRLVWGLPLLLTSARDTTCNGLADLIRSQLQLRFGAEAAEGWTLYRVDSSMEATRTGKVLWEEGESDDDERNSIRLHDREYLVVEWHDGLPKCIAAPMDEAAVRTDNDVVDLESCLQWHADKEQLSEDEAVTCEKCKVRQQASRMHEFWSLPPVLVMQLRRFERSSGLHCRRLSTAVRFPLDSLDLSRFCLSSQPSFPGGRCIRAGQRVRIHGLTSDAGQKLNGQEGVAMHLDTNTGRFCVRLNEDDPCADWKKMKPANLEAKQDRPEQVEAGAQPLYDLVAVSKHSGGQSLGYGHYVAYTRSSQDGKWRVYDDDEVRKVSEEEVASELTGAYVLFYLRRDCRPEGWGRATPA